MAKVLGIGGVFFKAADTAATGEWYRRVLGFELQDWGGAMFPASGVGHQVWSPFSADTDYFKPSDLPFMINLMVDDLDGVLAKAAAEGEQPTDRQEHEGMGKFAWLMDPNGLKIELWEPGVSPSTS